MSLSGEIETSADDYSEKDIESLINSDDDNTKNVYRQDNSVYIPSRSVSEEPDIYGLQMQLVKINKLLHLLTKEISTMNKGINILKKNDEEKKKYVTIRKSRKMKNINSMMIDESDYEDFNKASSIELASAVSTYVNDKAILVTGANQITDQNDNDSEVSNYDDF